MLLTDDSKLVSVAEKNYHLFKVPTNMVESRKAKRYYTSEQKADLDIKTSTNKIGDIINLAQELQSLMWHRLNNDETYEDIKDLYFDICQLSVLSGAEIDRAKKEFLINSTAELKKLKNKWQRRDEEGRIIKPYFFEFLAKEKGYYNPDKKNYVHHDTSMDYLHEIMDEYRSPRNKEKAIDLFEIIDFSDYSASSAKTTQIQKIIKMIQDYQITSCSIWNSDELTSSEKYRDYVQAKEELIDGINKMTINSHTLLLLFRRLNKDKRLKQYIVSILFNIGNQTAYQLIKKSKSGIDYLEEDPDGDIQLYNFHYSKKSQKMLEMVNENLTEK